MKLYTECFWDDWDRIVDIYVEKSDRVPEYINDEKTYKIVVMCKFKVQKLFSKCKLCTLN